MISRRTFLRGTALAAAAGASLTLDRWQAQAKPDLVSAFKTIEAHTGGKLGVAVMDTQTKTQIGYRAQSRFPMASTFKVLLAGAVLARVDAGEEQLDHRIYFDTAALPDYSPTTSKHVGNDGMTVAELCEAAVTLSDNGAANQLLDLLGGPQAVNDFTQRLGDRDTHLDRRELELNDAAFGAANDSTTPSAMLGSMHSMVLGTALSATSRQNLIGWLKDCKTGGNRLRAGFPKDWVVGDKTGTWNRGGTANDVAVIWPKGRAPVLIAVYLTGATGIDGKARDAAIAEVARAAVHWLA